MSLADGGAERAAPARYEDGYVTVGDIKLHYVDYGGTGEPVVALHGLVRGARSDVVPRLSARRMVEALPAARWAEVPGAGHAPTLYEPEAHTALGDFFALSAEPKLSASRALTEERNRTHEHSAGDVNR